MTEFGIQMEDDCSILPSIVTDQNEGCIDLYEQQTNAIKYFFEHNFKAVFEVTTGAGKTFCSIQIIKEIWKTEPDCKILIVVPKNVILENTWFKELFDNGISLTKIGVYYGAVKEFGQITITNMQNIEYIPFELFDCAIFDECFSGNTNVLTFDGIKYINIPIKQIVDKKISCIVPSFNIITGKIENQKIINWYKIEDKRKVLDIILEDETISTVTPEQLLFDGEKYIKANKLKVGDDLITW